MQKRGAFALLASLLLVLSITLIYARDNSGEGSEPGHEIGEDSESEEQSINDDEVETGEDRELEEETTEADEDKIGELIKEAESFDEELSESAGITADSPFYFVDEFFSRFSNNINNREEAVAEMRDASQRCRDGDQEACRAFEISRDNYEKYADDVENEVSPEEQGEAERSSRAIRGVLVREIAQNINPAEKDDLIREIVKKEDNIENAAKIALQIKALCSELAKLDPNEFHRACKTNEDSPGWQKDLFEDLSDEQKKEAKKFIEVISACFENPADCDCEASTNIDSFVQQCEIISKAENECRNNDDESACRIAEEAGEDILDSLEGAPHLQDALREIERRFSNAEDERFDHNIPRVCRDEGITGREKDARRECAKIMIEKGDEVPDECRPALREALDKGVEPNERKFREICEEIMFRENAPQECVEAGLRDHKECGKLMFQQSAPQECLDAGLDGSSPSDGKRCGEIMRKLGEKGGFDRRGPNRGHGSGSDCRGISDSEERLRCYDEAIEGAREGEFRGRNFRDRGNFEERYKETKDRERQCAEGCNGAWDFSGGRCSCRREDGNYERRSPPEGWTPDQGPPSGFLPPEGFTPPEGSASIPPESGTSPPPESSTTGGVVWGISGNAFLDYYYWRDH